MLRSLTCIVGGAFGILILSHGRNTRCNGGPFEIFQGSDELVLHGKFQSLNTLLQRVHLPNDMIGSCGPEPLPEEDEQA